MVVRERTGIMQKTLMLLKDKTERWSDVTIYTIRRKSWK